LEQNPGRGGGGERIPKGGDVRGGGKRAKKPKKRLGDKHLGRRYTGKHVKKTKGGGGGEFQRADLGGWGNAKNRCSRAGGALTP